ncbi:MAG: YggS family pyridoxal phosphate-dependent enzyme [Anaerolineales bacterium]|nr:YggS family pyridoxal phosphate-dependent enzyme [Anaerolineales bacterium]MCB9128802.1 YggS family pyridoxal phosphate-dependent enzyme [Ardenticatenales bacterium]MCB9171366.1 YggS family pyridoxal phosphate-dependent enzyme [Ardenticatenales bacterium]
MSESSFQCRWDCLQKEIVAVAERCGRNPSEITVVGVSKGHAPEALQAAYDAGFRRFGENRVSELLEKQAALALPQAEWHFIGHLQSRKAKALIGQVDLIHSLDRLSLAQELSKRAVAAERTVRALLQLNVSGEESKDGWEIAEEADEASLLHDLDAILALPQLQIDGLMTMAPYYEEAARTQPLFARLYELRERLRQRYSDLPLPILSMGMSNDFHYAITEGATHLRIGTALFGRRRYDR